MRDVLFVIIIVCEYLCSFTGSNSLSRLLQKYRVVLVLLLGLWLITVQAQALQHTLQHNDKITHAQQCKLCGAHANLHGALAATYDSFALSAVDVSNDSLFVFLDISFGKFFLRPPAHAPPTVGSYT